jgi:hypothetical protein
MSKVKDEMYQKFYASDIFNTEPNYARDPVRKPKIRSNHPTLECTKEDVFNVGKEKRIRRGRENEENDNNNSMISRSAEKRRKNYDNIYGSDIFNHRKPRSVEKRKGVKQIPNITNKTTLMNQIGNNEEYIKDLKYYTSQHRTAKKEYNPNLYYNKVTPQERYYKHHFANHGLIADDDNYNTEAKKLDAYIHNKVNLNNEIKRYNNVGADKKRKEGEMNIKEKRYFKQKPYLYDRKRKFVDSKQYPVNCCRINKQIQMESHIFTNADKNQDFDEKAKEINDRLELEKRKHYHTNVLGQPYTKYEMEERNRMRGLNSSLNEKWVRNLDWKSPEAEILYMKNNYKNRHLSARERKIKQLSDSQNVDTLSGLQKRPIDYRRKRKEKEENNLGRKKMDEIIDEIPTLKDGEKLGVKMKVSSLECNNDEDWNNKGKMLNDFYTHKHNRINRSKDVTGKVNDKHDKISNELKNYNPSDNLYHDYVITYATKGSGNQFEKFDEYDIQKLLGTKGIVAYDIHKNPFDKGNYNMVNLKIKGNDNNNQLYDKVKQLQKDLRKQNYKINIEKDVEKTHGKNYGKLMMKPGSKVGILNENEKEESNFKIMPEYIKKRRGFTKEYEHINYGYKRPTPF